MSTFLGVVGFVGFFASLIFLVIYAIRRKPKKKPLIAMAICFVIFAAGLGMTETDSDSASNDLEDEAKKEEDVVEDEDKNTEEEQANEEKKETEEKPEIKEENNTEEVEKNEEIEKEETENEDAKVESGWKEVIKFEGNSIKDTQTFKVSSNEWRISWDTKPGDMGDMNFQIYVYDKSGTPAGSYVIANVVGEGSDTSYMRGSGEYYFTINTAQPYTIIVEEKN